MRAPRDPLDGWIEPKASDVAINLCREGLRLGAIARRLKWSDDATVHCLSLALASEFITVDEAQQCGLFEREQVA